MSNDEKDFFPRLARLAAQSRTVLEVGVGDGRMINLLKPFGKAKFFGCDISRNARPACEFRIADARKLPYPNNRFDLVYSLGTVEHFPETDRAITEQARVCRRGGFVVCTVPHFGINATYRHLKCKVKNPEYTKRKIHEIVGRQIHKHEIERYFMRAGLVITASFAFGGIFPYDRTNPAFERLFGPLRSQCGGFLYIEGRRE